MSKRNIIEAAAGNSASGPSDPNFSSVLFLSHFNGTNGAGVNTFTDSSTNNFPITINSYNNDLGQGSYSPYDSQFGWYYIKPSNTYSIPIVRGTHNSQQNLGSNNFTIECFWTVTTGTLDYVYFLDKTSSYQFAFTGSRLQFSYTGSGATRIIIPTSAWSPTAGTTYHIAFTRSGTTCRFFVNGVKLGNDVTMTYTTITDNSSTIDTTVGGSSTSPASFLSNVRLVNGTALYTSNFTVPKAPLLNVSNTAYLTLQYPSLRDASSNNTYVKVVNGGNSLFYQAHNTYGPNPPSELKTYNSAVNGGSLYKTWNVQGGSNLSYLSTPDNAAFAIGTNDFTIEFWCNSGRYPASEWGATTWTYFAQGTSVASNTSVVIRQSGGYIIASIASGGSLYTCNAASTGTTSKLGVWSHVAFVRQNNGSQDVLTLYIDGKVAATLNISLATPVTNSTQPVAIGAYSDGTEPMLGYMADLRFVNGTAVYTGEFTPPTSPLSTIANTALHMKFIGSAVVDQAMNYDVIPVGTATLSTAQKKFGTSSLQCTTGMLHCSQPNFIAPYTPAGGLDITIEAWTYNFTGYLSGIAANTYFGGSGTFPFRVQVNPTTLSWYGQASTIFTASVTVPANQWNHIAFVKTGNIYSVYLNGVLQAQANGAGTTVWTTPIGPLCIAGGSVYNNGTAYTSTGYIDEVRVSSMARYTSDFTPPTLPFPDQ